MPQARFASTHPQGPVRAWRESITLPTYEPAPPDKNPMFLEKRVYQGSSGKVYPLPFTDRIAENATPRKWKALWIENEFLRVLVLPEIGGRIHRILDKTNDYDLIYYQPVIKPALVGLAGPWASGGIEFNWPQHHRPATFLPVDTEIERHADGSATIWCCDHDPMARMKGLHGVCLHPGRAYVELKVRASNRTPLVQTFLWWANVAVRVHEAYQSFFPPDVYHVADHARRSMSEYPLAKGLYYGVNYGERGQKGIPVEEIPAHYVPLNAKHPESIIGNRPSALPHYAPNNLAFYANIPVPTSYMGMGSTEDFLGGYDYKAQAGLVHIANHHIAPGKKQWTWGNHEFGYAWDRNLTDADAGGEFAPYIEIMAGVFTDNQPDFSFLRPGETRAWSQYWYPIQKIGPAQHANLDAAISLHGCGGHPPQVSLGVAVTRPHPRAQIALLQKNSPARGGGGKTLARFTRDLAPARPFLTTVKLPKDVPEHELLLRVTDRDGRELISYQPERRGKGKVPPPASEPPPPADMAGADELFVTGLHLDQYRHATRCPTLYWREAVRRDPLDARCNNALGLWHLKRGEFAEAEAHFRRAIARLTRRNANPADTEPFYNLGLCLRHQAEAAAAAISPSPAKGHGRDEGARLLDQAYAAFYKAAWSQAWAGAGCLALAELDCLRHDWAMAAAHARRASQTSAFNQRAMALRVLALQKSGEASQAKTLLRAFRRANPLDWWARHLSGEELTCDTQTLLDLALDYAHAGFHPEAIKVLEDRALQAASQPALPHDQRDLGTAPLVHYYLGWLHQCLAHRPPMNRSLLPAERRPAAQLSRAEHRRLALRHFKTAASLSPDYCFPSRLEEIAILQAAMSANPRDARAPYYLGNLLYDRRRHEEAIRLWERSVQLDPHYSVVWRNLGLGYFNIRRQPARALLAYHRATESNPADARLLFERDQLRKRLGEKPARRLRELEKHPGLVRLRDDLSVELCALYNQTGRHADALALVSSRHFQPWEGGEGGPLGQWVRSHLGLGRRALQHAATADPSPRSATTPAPSDLPRNGEDGFHSVPNVLKKEWDGVESVLASAVAHFRDALTAPANLGEAKHPLANQSDIHYWLGCALHAAGDIKSARRHRLAAATFKSDFQEMSLRAFSELSYFSALSWERLGQKAKAKELFLDLLDYAEKLQKTEAKIDYFATSLPTMLLFDDDLQFRQETTALFLQAQAHLGLGHRAKGAALLKAVLRRDPNHARAVDLSEGSENLRRGNDLGRQG